MSILGAVYYEEFVPAQYQGNWVKEERYEYCDGFYEKTKVERMPPYLRYFSDAAVLICLPGGSP